MKTLKQLIPFWIAFAIGTLTMLFATWLHEHGYISKLWDNIITIGIGPLLFLFFLPSILKK
mgnify:FL=1